MLSNVEKAFQRTHFALNHMCREMFRKDIELGRIAKVVSALLMAGLSPAAVPEPIIKRVCKAQREDGGWAGVQDTVWCAKMISFIRGNDDIVNDALKWVKDQHVEIHGWGRSKRDIGRIPVTGCLIYLFPKLGTKESCHWLEDKWMKEWGSLTYKAAYTLLAFKECHYYPEGSRLIDTVLWLVSQQEIDGGFGPWRGHPVGSNVLCTSLSVLSLLHYTDYLPDLNSINKAVTYLLQTQLPNGLWPYHQLDDGAVWGLLALKKYLEENHEW